MDIQKMMETKLFEGVEEDELTEMLYANPNNIRHYKKGELIAKQGDEMKGLLILTEGIVNNLLGKEDKKNIIVKTLHAPTLLLPAFVFASDPRFPITVKAAMDCEVVFVSRERLIRYGRKNNRLMFNVIREISDRFMFLTNRLHDFSTMTLKERLLQYIEVNGPITNQTELAQHMGVARPSISRALSELQKDGLIEK